ncbi:DoxX family protein [Candidatus Palauibacter sp.]|uniref:DoxX family protein n=1 Tax=Candidatus Palauibacter sp. TaxID=3101350 RepID=UPI003AF2D202
MNWGFKTGEAGEAITPRSWAAFVARTILGLIFFMAGFWKVFELGALRHARAGFVEPYADTFLPAWSLWVAGVATPFIELAAGALMLVGWRRRIAAFALGGVLILVTFGHLLAEPLYVFSAHVIPRTLLLVIVLLLFEDDRLSLDGWLARRTIPR